MKVLVKFMHFAWDNYQGASGKIIEMQKLIDLPPETRIDYVTPECIDILNLMGYVDDWGQERFKGKGIIRISII